MSLFEDISRFLEQRLEEYLRDHPQLELQVLDENLREQETDTQRLIIELQAQQKQTEQDILATAQDIQRWHGRIAMAQSAGRPDLMEAAQEREAALLRQGNQRWGQMQSVKTQIEQTQGLLAQIQSRRQEVQQRQSQTQAASRASADSIPRGWSQSSPYGEPDPLEEKFRRWETEAELERLKREMGR
jgi:uncharacterized protein (TIGR04376 family)